jgi:hypothetical protein
MKINISTTTGVVDYAMGDGVFVNERDLKQHPFFGLWEDLQGVVSDGNDGAGNASLTYEQYRDTGFLMYFTRHNQADIINVIYQMSHSWDSETNVYPHIHVIPMASGDGNVYCTFQYAWHAPGEVLPAVSEWTNGVVTTAFTVADQYKHKIIQLGAFTPPEGAGASSMLLIKLTRAGNNPLDTYSTNKNHETGAANLALMYCDVHYQKLVAGSVTQMGE